MGLNQRCVLALDYSSAQILLCTSIFIWSFVNININNTNMFNEDMHLSSNRRHDGKTITCVGLSASLLLHILHTSGGWVLIILARGNEAHSANAHMRVLVVLACGA